MEDALVRKSTTSLFFFISVLILVLMEDALVQENCVTLLKVLLGLNPCFNGRCTRTYGIVS